MKLYKIRKWNELFENNRSRELSNLKWTVIPNRHDGETYTTMITHPNGAQMFAAWVLIIQVASKCEPRGTLVRGNGTPLTPIALSVKTRAPVEWFEMALAWLEKHSDWVEVETVSDELTEIVGVTSHPPATFPHPPDVHPAPRDEEGKGKKGKEGREEPALEFSEFPTVEEVVSFGNSSAMIPEDYCRHYHEKCDTQHRWIKNGQLIKWKKEIVTWWSGDRATWKSKARPAPTNETPKERESRLLREAV